MEQMDLDFDQPTRHNNWYDWTKSWEDDKPGWYEHVIHRETQQEVALVLAEVVDYLYERVGKCERHCRWTFGINFVKVKFRYERDAILFALRF